MTISVINESIQRPSPQKNSVIVFDWDDTLMSSSWVDREKLIQIDSFSSLPVVLQQMFSTLEGHVAKCLNEATKLGSVIIITNAEAGWVEYSSKRFMPRLIPILNQTRIVSARSTYERFYPGAPLCWKAAAFAHEANVAFSQIDSESDQNSSTSLHSDSKSSFVGRQIISFGDSNEERTAVKIAAGQLDAIAKSIKFVDLPTPDQLCQQIETVTGWLQWVIGHTSELDLMMKASLNNLNSLDPTNQVSNVCDVNSGSPWRPPDMETLNDPVTRHY
mmetsp:Transcript_12941/g.15462  ORF Transcript_12941/g.15462 Transcript_12941/m.15462 type:complete len:275 (+) Transcript_12941:98-922(+)|eukprot:CAMPEP_0114341620 /NCGR_PEP_ID=MMETSP0101-20121206/9168_1 /TAXON_ID=38822 ORGANISM="Pteridomonas danica, Strain PT" /NCGR_SAMPLE_ID=MMETSP0101 /ASSEMBLY_ACC=CAM_ASM_000211 /LENGTH=274 /DNA_ID=CAMNT_0001475283 /DNA_START=114 /DNA_END=938 /DNA_ORIENTATION=+